MDEQFYIQSYDYLKYFIYKIKLWCKFALVNKHGGQLEIEYTQILIALTRIQR